MANDDNGSSFSHAFLPGLILGLVVGAVAGAFLPDWIGGSRIPAPTGHHDATPAEPRDGETEEDLDALIEEAQQGTDAAADTAGDLVDDAVEAGEDALEGAEEELNNALPGSGG